MTMTAHSTMVAQSKQPERCHWQVPSKSWDRQCQTQCTTMYARNGSRLLLVSSNSHSAGHNAPSPDVPFMEFAGMSSSKHSRAGSVAISRRTVCHGKGTGVAAQRFCDNKRERCGARIGCPGAQPRMGVSRCLGPSAWREPVPHPAYETLGCAGGCGRRRGLLEAVFCPLARLEGRDRRSNGALTAVIVRLQGAAMFVLKLLG